MSASLPVEPRADPSVPWQRTTATLSASQLISWGVLYYSFAIYLPQMNNDLGWSITAISAGFAIAIFISGLAAPLVGRIIDRSGSRAVMTVGALTGVVGLVTWASAQSTTVFYLAFAAIGVSHATTLYAPAFATVMHHHPSNNRKAIVTITLAGGFASSIFSPLAQILSEQGTWRTGLLTLASGFALTVIPLNLTLPHNEKRRTPQNAHNTGATPRSDSNQKSLQPNLRWIAAVWTLTAAVTTTFSVHIVAFLIDNGHGTTAAASIAGAAGLGKVGGRLMIATGARFDSITILRICLGAQAAFLILPLLWGTTAGSLLMVFAFGASSGTLTVLRPVILAEVFGTKGFAARNGQVQLVTTITKSSAPVLAGTAVGTVGYTNAWVGLAGITVTTIAVTYQIKTQPS